MMRSVPCAFAFLSLTVTLAWAAGALRLTEKDSGRTVSLHKGDRLTLALRENPSTGYSWKVVSAGEPVIEQVGEPAFKPDSSLHGASGTVTYRFRAATEGTGALKLVYLRPWEKDTPPKGTFEVTVVVNP